MKSILFTIASACAVVAAASCSAAHESAATDSEDFTAYVDPFIGTGGHGHVFLGANVPFGLVQLGPSQTAKGWDWCSGYHYSDSTLRGFAHTHLSGTGIGDLGDILFFPTADPALDSVSLSHLAEQAMPGYYSVVLKEANTVAELSATTHAGIHRYSFPATDSGFVKINLHYGIGWDKPSTYGFAQMGDSAISGHRFSTGWAKDQKIYFHSQFSRPMARCTIYDSVAICVFAPSEEPLIAKVGISVNSAEKARRNLMTEIPGFDFDSVRTAAADRWNRELSRVKISTSSDRDKRVFYTSLFHTMTAPVTFSDAEVAPDSVRYSVFSLWDTYRAAHPLYSLLFPEMQPALAATFMDIYKSQGKLPVWHLHGNETDCMIGNPGIIVLADMLLKGYVSDPIAALEAMKTSALLDERSLDALKRYGYVPFDAPGCEESVAKGLEYAVADDAIARVCNHLAQPDSNFTARARAYARYFDPSTRFMRGIDSLGNFRPGAFNPFATAHRADDYCEGNAWQYVWMVPHDPHGLVQLFGSEEAFEAKLDSLFMVEGQLGENASPDISGLIGQYAHGNEPSHHTVYLYNYIGRPDKAAPLLRQILTELYHDTPDGLCGNEDVGQMSAWYVLSSMGLYQVEPAGGRFVIGSPLYDSATIALPDGKSFTIAARNNSADNIYVQHAQLNGAPYSKSYIDYADLMAGGELLLEMGAEPSQFGYDKSSRP